MRPVRVTFAKLYDAANKLPAPSDNEKLALTWLGYVLEANKEDDDLEDLLDAFTLDSLTGYGKSTKPAPILEGESLLPSKALELLCAAVESHIGLLKLVETDEELASCIFQIEAMCGYFEAVFDDEDASLIVHNAFELT